MLNRILIVFMALASAPLPAQDSLPAAEGKQRLDFARTYFELGATGIPSFTGKRLRDNQVTTFRQPAVVNQYLTWGAFHFWGHAEFYVTFPLERLKVKKNGETDFSLNHAVVTGTRYYPWAVKEKKMAPYLGISWGAIDFRQTIKPEENQPKLSKDFLLNYEAGLLYNYGNFGLRFALNYYPDTKWSYPLSRTLKSEIKTPSLSASLGLLYTFDLSRANKKETVDRWNSYPRSSRLSYKAKRFGNFFLGAGPSLSFSLANSLYNREQLPYLKERLVSGNYFDLALGYHFNKANLFTAVSFRNPKFVTEGYESKQTIRKTSLALEVNGFLTDYSGFAPYIGLNVAFNRLKYHQKVDDAVRNIDFRKRVEPGVTFGWDVVPGKTEEALILRTNLRWYPFSEFKIDNRIFDFRQLEYNLIQVVFYPERWKRKK